MTINYNPTADDIRRDWQGTPARFNPRSFAPTVSTRVPSIWCFAGLCAVAGAAIVAIVC